MLFMGEEWGATTPWQFFTSHPEPELADGRTPGAARREFAAHGWARGRRARPAGPGDLRALDGGLGQRLDAPEHASMLDLYRSLIALRRSHPELADPSLDGFVVEVADDDSWLVMHRGSLRVVVNFAEESFEVRTSDWSPESPEHVLLSWD